jgi:pectate lyase
LRGTDAAAAISGSLILSGSRNVILQNFTVDAGASSFEDGVSITESAHHLWTDHLTVLDAADGNLDIKRESDFITISWTKFYYARGGDHRFSNLVGHSDDFTADDDNLNITYHHCWWSDGVIERMPRIRFGDVHSYNNYFNSPGNNYCIRAAKGASVLIENNYFQNVKNPHEINNEDGVPANVTARGNIYDNTTGEQRRQGTAFTPPYHYTLDDADAVPDMVRACAGPR